MALEPGLPIGPSEWRASAAGPFHDCVLRASPRYGVTRLADVTRLDRLGLPVWQSIRPAGRSLSVHQGKGVSHLSARIGALCEAIETDCAERCTADGPRCTFEALSESERAPHLSDYSRDRTQLPRPGTKIEWCIAGDLLTGNIQYLPIDLVSLDLSRKRGPFGRDSTGLALGENAAEAFEAALCEVIERDAVGAWDRSGRSARLTSRISPRSIPFDWFRYWLARFEEQDIAVRIYAPAAIAGLPTLIVSIGGMVEFGNGYRRFSGTAAHSSPEVALFKAMAEAIQSRLTFVAGVRDDIMPSSYDVSPPPDSGGATSAGTRRWEEIAPHPGGWEALASRVAELGYHQIVAKRLDDGEASFAVVKLFVPGLGSLRRHRRIGR